MFRIIIAITLLFCAISVVVSSPWDSFNNPSVADSNNQFVYKLNNLPMAGSLNVQPWSDTYWPSYQSGIAHRWNSDNPNDFNYDLMTKEQLQSASVDVLQSLSPAEKLDVFNSRYDYPTVHSEWSRTSPNDATWEGLCHGWSPASLSFSQPNPVSLNNADNITIPFGSSDVKALLTYWTGEYDEQSADTWFLAQRCNYDLRANPSRENSSACRDINAGAFHVTISNMIGTLGRGFVGDRDRSIQVWNQPIFAFNSTVISSSSSQVEMKTVMSYGKETYPQWDAHPTNVVSEEYYYNLELDSNGNVVGGSHITWDRLDFQWMVAINAFSGYFTTLQQIYQASVNQTAPREHLMELSLRPQRRLPATLPNHQILNTHQDSFGVDSYPDKYRSSWTIAPQEASSIEITFVQFNTARYHDKVKIYEGANGEGALVAVLHGSELPQPVRVNTGAAYVLFVSDSDYNGSFKAVYTAL